MKNVKEVTKGITLCIHRKKLAFETNNDGQNIQYKKISIINFRTMHKYKKQN